MNDAKAKVELDAKTKLPSGDLKEEVDKSKVEAKLEIDKRKLPSADLKGEAKVEKLKVNGGLGFGAELGFGGKKGGSSSSLTTSKEEQEKGQAWT